MSVLRTSLLCLIFIAIDARADIVLLDDAGREIRLADIPAKIVSLAPHVTELLFAAGASGQVIGAVDFSDYPEQAKSITRVGSYNKFDVERIIALNPDLIIAWKSGNPDSQVNELIQLGFKVYFNEPRKLEDVAQSLRQLGQLLATETIANPVAREYEQKLSELRIKYKDRSKVRVFYQVWKEPLFTVNGEHIISRVIELCGGINVFSELKVLAPNIDKESVIAENPDVIIAGMNDTRLDWLSNWKQWTSIKAVKNNHLYSIDADLIVRHTPRILLGIEEMCIHLEKARG
ncbi:MAG: cobalamin-binding protein [Gammaproteobacteria bacterium]